MFEAVVALCAELAEGPCRDVLVPGYAASELVQCEELLATTPPDPNAHCMSAGPVLDVVGVAPGVWVHVGQIAEVDRHNLGDISNLGFVIGDRSVAVIDSGAAAWIGEALWRSIRTRTDLPVSHVILTHMHPDHVMGTSVFEAMGAKVLGHSGLTRALADRQANYLESLNFLIGVPAILGTRPPGSIAEIGPYERIDLGSRVLELRSWPMAHTGTDVTVFDRQTGTLFAGDLVFDRHLPALDGSLRGWQRVLDEMQDEDIVRIIPGHGGPTLDWPEGLEPMRRYLEVLARDTLAAIQAGERLGQAVTHIAGEEQPEWDLFNAFNPRNATVAFTELEWE